ncbi:MAG: hypothetical protein ACXAC7_18815 [Candidatus Hodarchaeales archaeon]|jgi:ABC-type transport system involved in multi-copper enzyme maturation permease subunit
MTNSIDTKMMITPFSNVNDNFGKKGRILNHIYTELDLEKVKIFLIFISMVFMALSAVITQVLLPDIMEWSGLQVIGFPEPSIISILTDFWGDIYIFALIMIFYGMNTFSAETDIKKQVYFNLSRPISRRTYFMTRYFIRITSVVIIIVISSLIAFWYGMIFFDPLPIERVLLASIIVGFSLASIISVVIMASSYSSTPISAGMGLTFLFIQMIFLLFEPLKWLSPIALSDIWLDIMKGVFDAGDAVLTIIVLILWIIIPGIIGLWLYEKRDL